MPLILIFTFIASYVGTVTGFGTSTILVPLLIISYPLPETLLFVAVVHLFNDFWKILFWSKGLNLKLILLFGLPGILVAYLASNLPQLLPEDLLKKLLGISLVVYVSFIFLKPKWQLHKSNFNALLGGSLSGLFAAVFGIGGPVRSAFLAAFNLKKTVYLFTSGAIGVLIDTSRIAGYLQNDFRFQSFTMSLLIFAIITSFIAASAAKKTVNVIPEQKFRQTIALALFVLGLYLLT